MAVDITKLKVPIKNNNVGEMFGKLFQIRDQIHLTHLKVSGNGSFAAHKALNEFYDGILDLTDTLIESCQGKFGLYDIIIPESKSSTDAISLISELASLTDGGKYYTTFKETWIQNQMDEISALCYQTLYKLKNLK